MRLHQLEIEAFGPFARLTTVDFDDLSSAGLFLLSGATGAGKSSVLDAVCFALYGDVPGDRSSAKRLRCDQAEAMTTPRVTLEATLSGRRFRIVRSASWDRPKRRGQGTTTQPAAVTISELIDDQWHPLSSRIDETGDLISHLIGMTLVQFTQVAMLPQGRFQAFLRAKSDDRHQLLQKLFRTGRFEQVERWLREHRLALSREHDLVHQRAADLVSRISETAGVELPDTWDVHDLSPVVDDDVLREWARDLVARARVARASASEEVASATAAEIGARAALEDARTRAERRARYDAARADLHALLGRSRDQADDVRRLDAARRAATVLPHHRVASSAARAAASARRTASAAQVAACARLSSPLDPTATVDLSAAADQAAQSAAAVRALQPRATRLDRAAADLSTIETRRAQLQGEIDATRAAQAELPGRVEALRADVRQAHESAARLDSLTQSSQALTVRLEAHGQSVPLRRDLDEARGEWLDAREQTLALKEELITLQHARIEGMAAELASQLAVGCDCPVCGSASHPRLASSVPDAPDATTERHARSLVDNAAVVELAFDQKLRNLETSLASALARAGDGTLETLTRERDELREAITGATSGAAMLPSLVEDLDGAEATLAALGQRLADLSTQCTRADAEQHALAEEVAGLRREVDVVLDGSGHRDLESLLADHRVLERLCREAVARESEAASAERLRDEAEAAATDVAREASFLDVAEAITSALDAGEVQRLSDAITAHEQRLASAQALLSEPDSDELLAETPADLDALLVVHRTALAERDCAVVEERLWSTRDDRLTGLLDDLEHLLGSWLPLRAQLTTATRLSSFVEGKSVDNALRMRLSAYVLAYRLSQVVAAANERLARMSDQRYALEHTGRRGAGETRGGLSLLIRDDWSGRTRDPATLSGGETFVVSLALALGLADVITQESGGAALDTLFVDEGFGSLDADTLDDVMDTIDSLRDGGRIVGLVSHVAEMRDRIPTQLHVTKSREGSTVHVRR